MPGIDEVSRLLGSIDARLSAAEKHHEDVTKRLDAVASEIRRVHADMTPIKQSVAEMEPEVRLMKTLRNRGIGLLVGVGLIGGGTGIGLLKAIEGWLSSPSP